MHKNKLVIISGCSGGGKSTLIEALQARGFHTMPEVGREIVKEALANDSEALPWKNPPLFAERLIAASVLAYEKAKQMALMPGAVIFFDRSYLEGISYLHHLGVKQSTTYDFLIAKHRYASQVFMTPPWQEIYRQDEERQHSYAEAESEYTRLSAFYPQCGYDIVTIPKANVDERVDFILLTLGLAEI